MRLRIKGFELELSYPCFCLFTAASIINCDYLYCIAAVIIHEFGHIAAMLWLKAEVKGLQIKTFDIRIKASRRYSLDFKSDLIISAAGPAANIIVFLLFFYFARVFSVVNLLIGTFNMLPAASLDGGQLLYLVLSKRFSREKSAVITDVLTVLIAIFLFAVGIIVLFGNKYNFSLLFISVFLFLSIFMKDEKYL